MKERGMYMGISDTEWDMILMNVRMSPLSRDEKRSLLMELAAKHGRTLTQDDFIKAGVVQT
jgi:hypothetical protein